MPRCLLLLAAAVVLLVGSPRGGDAATYYVRQTVGNDGNDGLSPATAWRSVSRLSAAMAAGDTAYVGPGLYRDAIAVRHDGTADGRIVFIADTAGQHTGDPPGPVMITGAEPVDEAIFVPHTAPGVYQAPFPEYPVLGVVEMDGPQYRYARARDTDEHLVKHMPELEAVVTRPSTYHYDADAKVLYLHTSDGKPPDAHEMEIIKRGNGIHMVGKHYVTITGFVFRHVGDAGINFFKGSGDGVAINNTSYGSRQGIRVYNATNVLVHNNTLFRNDNSGVYFAATSTTGVAIGNTAYENSKGVRWSSQSANGMAINNVLFDNHECGVAIESTADILVTGNRVVNNAESQLMSLRGEYSANANCFDNGVTGKWIADFVFTERYETLAEYRRMKRQDWVSREGGCGPLPEKVDVRRLHAETMAYAERARKLLAELPATAQGGSTPTSATPEK